MIEAGLLIGLSPHDPPQPNYVLYFHNPAGRDEASLPDSHDLWRAIWERRETVTGFAHSHPGYGSPRPSSTDLSTFAAIEAGLGKRLRWWIATSDQLGYWEWDGQAQSYLGGTCNAHKPPWLETLREMSNVPRCSRCGTVCEGGHTATRRVYDDGTVEEFNIACFDCDREERFATYAQTRRLGTRLLIDASLIAHAAERHKGVDPTTPPEHVDLALEIQRGLDYLRLQVKRFEREVWYGSGGGKDQEGGLQKQVNDSWSAGMSAKLDGFKLLTFCSAGRCMLTLDADDASVTLITADNEPMGARAEYGGRPDQGPMGLHGIDATIARAWLLIQEAITAWERRKLKLRDDREVGIG